VCLQVAFFGVQRRPNSFLSAGNLDTKLKNNSAVKYGDIIKRDISGHYLRPRGGRRDHGAAGGVFRAASLRVFGPVHTNFFFLLIYVVRCGVLSFLSSPRSPSRTRLS